MKLSSRGFTLVELMIVIAIIGILAAVLFPSVTRYLVNGRDTNRMAAIGQIATAVTSYYTTAGSFPAALAASANCISSGALANELPKFPVDPVTTRTHGGCTVAGVYGFGTGTNASSTPMYAVSAQLEAANGGNTATAISNFQGTVTSANLGATFTKGSGSGYVLIN